MPISGAGMVERVGRMEVYRGTDHLTIPGCPVVTVGSFDGVHLGHKALLRATVQEAGRRGEASVAVTFWPHPRKVLKSTERTWLLSPLDEKLRLLAACGIDATVVVPFDEEFSRMGSREFIDGFIVGRFHASAMVVGYDHRFGHNKTGDYGLLQRSGVSAGLDTIKVAEQTSGGIKISSTEVRKAVAEGDMAMASQILGHNYFAIGALHMDDTGTWVRFRPSDNDKLLPSRSHYKVLVRNGFSVAVGELAVGDGVYTITSGEPLTAGGTVEIEFL